MYSIFCQNTDYEMPKTFVFKGFWLERNLLSKDFCASPNLYSGRIHIRAGLKPLFLAFEPLLIYILPKYRLGGARKLIFSNVFCILAEYRLEEVQNLCFQMYSVF